MLRKWTRPRFLILYLLIPLGFLEASTSEAQFRLGIPLVSLGLLLRLWANGHVGHRKVNWTQKWRGDAKVGHFITGGPYAYVRHPLYVGTFLVAVGFGVIVGQRLLGVAALAALALIYRGKMAEEEATLEDEWGEEFLRYERAVPRWLPRRRPFPDQVGAWHWDGITASKEWKTVLWVVVALIALYLREEWWQERELFAGESLLKHVVFLVIAVTLMVTDGVIELSRRRAKAMAR